ncbi:Uncharacterised protein [Klebsiella pneumoniae]|nr:Uncharacterised protein [Klebsiella pneumoniae]
MLLRVKLAGIIQHAIAKCALQAALVAGGQCANQIRLARLRQTEQANCRVDRRVAGQYAGLVVLAQQFDRQAIRFHIQARRLLAVILQPLQRLLNTLRQSITFFVRLGGEDLI